MPRHWYLKTRHRTVGPITSKQLIRLAAKGKIGPRNGVSSDGESWIKARQVQGLDFGKPASSKPASSRPTSSKPPTEIQGKRRPRIQIKTRRGVAGPFTIEKLQRLIAAGKAHPNSPAREDADGGEDCPWIRADQITDLSFPEKVTKPAPTQVALEKVTGTAPVQDIAHASLPQAHLDHRRALKAHFCSSLTVDAADAQGIEVLSFPATKHRPFKTLVTNGVLPDTESPIELLLYVDDDHAGIIGLVRHLANMVRYAICEASATVAVGTVIANGHPAAPIAPESALDHFLFLPPPIAADQLLREPSNPRRYLWVQPISAGERDVRNSRGLTTLVAAIQAEDHRKTSPGCVFDPFRQPLFAVQPAPRIAHS